MEDQPTREADVRLRVVTEAEFDRIELEKRRFLDCLSDTQKLQLRRLFRLGSHVDLAGVRPNHSDPEDWETITGFAGALEAMRQRRHAESWHGKGIAQVQLFVRNPGPRQERSQRASDHSHFLVPVRFDLWHVRRIPDPLLVNPRFRHFFGGPSADPHRAQMVLRVGHPDSRVQFHEDFRYAARRCDLPPLAYWWAARIAELDLFERLLAHPPLLQEIREVMSRHAQLLGLSRVARLYAKPVRESILQRMHRHTPSPKPNRQKGHLRLVD